MLWGGILDLSTVDFPGKLCSVIFFAGCPFRCPYCQNYRLLEGGMRVSVDEIVAEVKKNFLIDGVCFTGGEPLAQNLDELVELIRRLKDLGLAVKVDTNGYYPERLSKILDLIDYVAMDFKTIPQKYPKLTGKKDSAEKVLESLKVLADSGVEYEVRTTVVPTIVDRKEIEGISKILSEFGVKRYVLQQFRNEDVLDDSLKQIDPYPKAYLFELGRIAKAYVPKVLVRCEGEEEV